MLAADPHNKNVSQVATYPLYDFSMMLPTYNPYPIPVPELYAFPQYWAAPPPNPYLPVPHGYPACFPPQIPIAPSTRPFAIPLPPEPAPPIPSPVSPNNSLPMVHQQGYPPGPPPTPVIQPPLPNPPQTQAQSQPPDDQFLLSVFQRVNRDKSGYISASELQSALSNGTWKPFNPETVRMMIDMFGKVERGKVNIKEFSALWSYVSEWLACFQVFDLDGSGNIDRDELREALHAFGYRMTDKFYGFLVYKFDREGKGAVNFDDFIQCCVVLQALTTSFRVHDEDQDGWVKMTYEQFLLTVFRLRL